METASHHGQDEEQSLKQSWQHCRQLFRANTTSEAWCSLKHAVDALPLWALILLPIFVTLLVIESSLLTILAASVAFLWATYKTVKLAVADALRERDS